MLCAEHTRHRDVGGYQPQKKSKAGVAGTYFLAGKSLRWPAIGLALFATNLSTVYLVSLAQSGFDTGRQVRKNDILLNSLLKKSLKTIAIFLIL